MKKIVPVKWKSVQAEVKGILPTPKNYKIKTELGKERLALSLKKFGLAGNCVCNWNGKYGDKKKLVIVDGNSRLEDAKEKKEKLIWVSVPDRKLSPKEFVEMSAMFDFAKAGEVDLERIDSDLGTSDDFFTDWGREVPLALLEKMGSNAPVKDDLKYPEKKGKGGKAQEQVVADIRMVNLFFSDKQEAEFRKMEEVLKKKFKVNSTTETVFKAFQNLVRK